MSHWPAMSQQDLSKWNPPQTPYSSRMVSSLSSGCGNQHGVMMDSIDTKLAKSPANVVVNGNFVSQSLSRYKLQVGADVIGSYPQQSHLSASHRQLSSTVKHFESAYNGTDRPTMNPQCNTQPVRQVVDCNMNNMLTSQMYCPSNESTLRHSFPQCQPSVSALQLTGQVMTSCGPTRNKPLSHVHNTVAPYPNQPQLYMMQKRAQFCPAAQGVNNNRQESSQIQFKNPILRSSQLQKPTTNGVESTSYMSYTATNGTSSPSLISCNDASGLPPNAISTAVTNQGPVFYKTSQHQSHVSPVVMPTSHTVSPLSLPAAGSTSNSARLSLPLADGVILPPFKLEHSKSSCSYNFFLHDTVYQNLMTKNEMDVELRCRSNDELAVSWPAGLAAVYINNVQLPLNRAESHHPLYVRSVCRPGVNSLQINVSQCCCTHSFTLQIVNCPSLRSVIRGLLVKRLLPAEHGIKKIKRCIPLMHQSGIIPANSSVQSPVSVNVSLSCPISRRKISMPARGHGCTHIQCFDLESYIIFNSERNIWRCPICRNSAPVENLEVDQFMWGIMRELATTSIDEVTIDINGGWKPVFPNAVHSEHTELSGQRWSKTMTVSNITLPNLHSWVSSHRGVTGMHTTSQGPTSPESIVPYSPLSCLNDPNVVPNPCQPPGTPDRFVVPTSGNLPALKSPSKSDIVTSVPVTPHHISPHNQSLSSLVKLKSDGQVLSSLYTSKLPANQQHINAQTGKLSDANGNPSSDVICFDTEAIFSEQQKKEVIDDILSDTIPDLGEFLPSSGNSTQNAPAADDDLLSLFV